MKIKSMSYSSLTTDGAIKSKSHILLLFMITETAIKIISLSFLLNQLILQPLESDNSRMERWDPTEIISLPLASGTVTIFLVAAFKVVFLLAVTHNLITLWTKCNENVLGARYLFLDASLAMINGTFGIILACVIFTLLFIVCGASPWKNISHTIMAASYLVILIFGPSFYETHFLYSSGPILSLLLGTQFEKEHSISGSGLYIFWVRITEIIHRCELYSCIMGTILCMVLLILDHGHQFQRWPIPVLLGATYGCAIGGMVGICAAVKYICSQKEKY